jgi:hypothetical protein
VAAAVTGAVLAPLVLVHAGNFLASAQGTAAPSSTIFQPWQAWWFLGHHGPVVHGLLGNVKVGYRTAPGWVGEVSHPLIVALALPLSGLFWWCRRGEYSDAREPEGPRRERVGVLATGARSHPGSQPDARVRTDALGLLALLLLLRCVLDTWDAAYYPLPCVLALLAWEVHGDPVRARTGARLPLLALSCTVLAWLSFQWLPEHASADLQSAFFMAWTLPLIAALCVRLYAPQRAAQLLERVGGAFAWAGGLSAPDGLLRRPRSAPWTAR